jgi:hypothetical protein
VAEIDELGLGKGEPKPRYQTREAMAPFRLLQHVNLVDHHRPDPAEVPSGPEDLVDPLVGPDDDL